MKIRKLGGKLLVSFLALSLVLIVCISVVITVEFWKNTMAQYQAAAFSYTRAAAQFIDGDRILSYAATGNTDDYYQYIQNYMDLYQQQTNMEYFFVYVPGPEGMTYIWDTDEDYDENGPLGFYEAYQAGEKELAESVFRKDPAEVITVSKSAEYGFLASAHSPIFSSSGEPVAVVAADLSMPEIRSAFFRFIVAVVISIFLVVAASVFLMYRSVRDNIVEPINSLTGATRAFVDNIEKNEPYLSDIHTGDEIEVLSRSFEKLDGELKEYIRKYTAAAAEKEKISAELKVAQQIQESLLPRNFHVDPSRDEFGIYATMTPAKEVGGDFYDFFMVDARHVAVVIADVSGKGVPAALFMAIAKALIKDHTEPGIPLSHTFQKVNNLLCESNNAQLFVTAFEGVLDLLTGEFIFVNAGHEIPYICRKGETFTLHKLRPGFVLAGMENIRYKTESVIFEPGDKLFQYTDGVTEATNSARQLYGQERLTAVLGRYSSSSPEELLPLVRADIDAFAGDAPQFDDITMLCLEYKKRMPLPVAED